MKNTNTKSIIIWAAALLLTFQMAAAQTAHEKNETPYKGPAEMPEFTFQSVLGTPVTRETLVKNKPVIVVFFDPTCEHCQQEATWISAEIEKFAQINLLFVSWGKKDDIMGFAEKYFGPVKNKVAPGMLNFTMDTKYKIDSWFGDSPVPSIHIYGKTWKHSQSFFNETAVEELLKWAK